MGDNLLMGVHRLLGLLESIWRTYAGKSSAYFNITHFTCNGSITSVAKGGVGQERPVGPTGFNKRGDAILNQSSK